MDLWKWILSKKIYWVVRKWIVWEKTIMDSKKIDFKIKTLMDNGS